MSNWNMDMNIAKDIHLFRERVFATLSFQFVNVFNHVVQNDPYLDISDPNNWGVLGSNNPSPGGNFPGGQVNSPRKLTFSLHLTF
jgi:hypothetical protein